MEEVPRVIWECLGDITVRARFVQVTTVADLKRCMVYGMGAQGELAAEDRVSY